MVQTQPLKMEDEASVNRQLKIKVDATKRLLKEHTIYRKDEEVQKRKLEKLRAENADEWEVKVATRLLEETQRMIQVSDERLGKAVQELRTFITSVKSNPRFGPGEYLIFAEEALEEASV